MTEPAETALRRPGPAPRREARFVTGSTMRHVTVMTLTGSLGLSFAFLVDFITLFWIGQLGDPTLIAAAGFAWTIQYLTISLGIGLMIASVALVSRAIGARDWEGARAHMSSAVLMTFTIQATVAAMVWIWREPVLALLGARGETLAAASDFLRISIPSLPIMAVGFSASAGLRATGDAMRSMMSTLSAGVFAVFLDPIFILSQTVLAGGLVTIPFGLGLGIDGAAWVLVISRGAMSVLAIWWLVRVHDLLGPLRIATLKATARPFFRIALPAVATQISTPVGHSVVTLVVSGFGDSAVAGWSVVSRLMILAFGGIFALSGAIGGILGQNYGAGQTDRVARAYRDALIFCLAYTMTAWLLLILATPLILTGFGISGAGAEVVWAFTLVASGGFVFTGWLFVANSAFNNLGRPLWSTGFNWARDFIVMAPFCYLLAQRLGAAGAVYGQALAGVVIGSLAAYAGWKFVRKLDTAPSRS